MIQQVAERPEDLEGMPEPSRDDDGKILAYDWKTNAYILRPEAKAPAKRGPFSFAAGRLGPTKLRNLDDTSGTPGPATNGYAYLYNSTTDTFELSEVATGNGTSTIAGATDFDDTTGAGTDGYAIVWDNDDSRFELAALPTVITDHGALSGKDDDDHPQYFNTTRGDARYGQLTADQTWTGLNRFDQNPVASWFDVPIVNAQGNSFNENAGGTPSGWTQITSASTTNTNERLGFWYLREAGSGSGYAFSKQTTFSDADFPAWFSTLFGPIMWRDGAYTADADWYFGVHADDGGSASTDDWIRANLNWNATDSIFRVRGQYSINGTVTDGDWENLAFPPPQPLYFRVTGRMDNGESDRQRVYVGTVPIADAQTNILTATSPHGDFDNFHVKIEHVKSSSPESYLYFGGLDFGDDP